VQLGKKHDLVKDGGDQAGTPNTRGGDTEWPLTVSFKVLDGTTICIKVHTLTELDTVSLEI
jgi:hypothetical protein